MDYDQSTEKGIIKEYLSLFVRTGKAEYDHRIIHNTETLNSLVKAKTGLERYKMSIEDYDDELLSADSLENYGYVAMSYVKMRRPGDREYFVGKIEFKGSDGVEYYGIRIDSKDFEGLPNFRGYSGRPVPAIIKNKKIYLILDVIERYHKNPEDVLRIYKDALKKAEHSVRVRMN